MPFFGTGGLGERIWTGPAVTVTGMDVLPVDKAVNAVVPYARAKVSLRVHPEQDPVEAQRSLIDFLEGLRPFGVVADRARRGDRDGLCGGDVRPGLHGGARRRSRARGAARR